MTSINALVGGNVRARRLDRGLTQRDLADKLGGLGWKIDATALARIESGERALRIEQVETLSQALRVDLGELVATDQRSASAIQADAQAFIAAIDDLIQARQRYDEARLRLERHVSVATVGSPPPRPIEPKVRGGKRKEASDL